MISFETAKLAKEKGLCDYFEKINPTTYVNAFYSEDEIEFEETEFMQEDCIIDDRYFRPTQSLLQKWLREKHKIDIFIQPIDVNVYVYCVGRIEINMAHNVDDEFTNAEVEKQLGKKIVG